MGRSTDRVLASLSVFFCFSVALLMGQQAWAAPQPGKQKTNESSSAVQPPAATGVTIKSQASSVVVDVIVTRKGHHVAGLGRSDFEVYDNGARQQITTFVPPLTPSEEAKSPKQAPAQALGKGTGQPTPPQPAGPAERRAFALARIHFVTLVLDLGDMQGFDILRATKAAEQYVAKTVAPDDFISIYWVGGSLHLALPFTQEKDAAVSTLKQLGSHVSLGALTANELQETQREIRDLESKVYGGGSGAGPTAGSATPCENGGSEGQAAICMMEETELVGLRQYMWSASDYQARAVITALRAIALSYRGLPGRKNVVVFSNGFIHSPDAKLELSAAIDAANHADVSFYIVDAGGLRAGISAESATAPATDNTELYRAAMIRPSDSGMLGNDKFDWVERSGMGLMHQDLGQLASATGGFYVENENDLLDGLKLVDSDLREFYTLVYQPSDIRFDGSFHTIKVVLNRSGYKVRYRLGYWATPSSEETLMTPAAAQLISSVRSGAVQPEFTPEVNAAVLLAPDAELAVPVEVSVPAKFVKIEHQSGDYRTVINMVVLAKAKDGRVVSVYQHIVALDLKKNQWKEFEKKKRLDIGVRLPLDQIEPLEVEAILRFSDGKVGVGLHKIALAGTNDAGPTLTSVVLSTYIFRAQGVTNPTDPLQGANFRLELPARPAFSSSDRLTVYFGVLHLRPAITSGRAVLRLGFSILKQGSPVRSFPPEETQGKINQTELAVLRQFPLQGLQPGDYQFHVKVEDSAHHVAESITPFVIQQGSSGN
jgi:VWFA-related protein